MVSWKRIYYLKIIVLIALSVPSNLYKLKEPLSKFVQYLFRLNQLFRKYLQWRSTAPVLKMCFTGLFPSLQTRREKTQLSSSISQDLDLMTCPLSSQPFLSGQLRAEVTLFFFHVYLPIFALNCSLLSPAVTIFLLVFLGTPASATAPQGWRHVRMLTNPRKQNPTKPGVFHWFNWDLET